MLISKLMYSFLKDYIKWIEEGATESSPYSRWDGLCCNTFRFSNNVNNRLLLEELKILFKAENLDTRVPFGEENYRIRSKNQTQHEDLVRLKWITEHIGEYEKVNTIKS